VKAADERGGGGGGPADFIVVTFMAVFVAKRESAYPYLRFGEGIVVLLHC